MLLAIGRSFGIPTPSPVEAFPLLKLRIGLIGLGPTWASRHKPALRALTSRFEVRAVCDPVAHRAEQVAAELGARSMVGFRSLAACEDIDALLLLSARWYGALPILAACDYGKAAYCGASISLETDQAQELRDRVRQSGIAFMAEFPKRLAPATIRLQELIATRLGPPKLLFCNERHASPSGDQRNADVNMRHLVEIIDWCRYVVGREATHAHGVSHTSPAVGAAEDYLLITLHFADEASSPKNSIDGPMAQIACGSYVPAEWSDATSFRRPADMQVICESGMAFIDFPNTLVWFDQAGQHTESLDSERPVGEQLLMHFHRSVASLVLKTSGLEDAYRAMSLVNAARRSHAEGRRVDCPPLASRTAGALTVPGLQA